MPSVGKVVGMVHPVIPNPLTRSRIECQGRTSDISETVKEAMQ
jgi:hypothetical protein